ncbi:MAG: ABC transporter substrate-binding protein [Alcaligenaceae bacterium]|jgi:branched-chain amino acid transport system substrate-binding protein|uniref:ABC transporter substrate-binding protein n=1 Tax=Neopusillimonas maritima TaxID=2026239 RepID=A0A3A1YX92_9BURK|nr:ABC transporter substrate-binding protein [Neopusillimonas maritima]MAL02527.1 ABC transporter substrate-binding protein [Alcaligenaceae bacterium]RIY41450.1 ABC transporter substrate-binding protein [Neopusillimonas maritima]|tara:strand:- start:186274 stop:187446 length:1173 start_codon:yes stop_codon:yes gene_type:complete
MLKKLALGCMASAVMALSTNVMAKDPVRIGFITTLSTPAGYLGEDARDGFNLAIKQGNGTLGGVAVETIVEDDGLKPANGKQIADRLLADDVKLFTGVIFSNVLTAIAPSIAQGDSFYVSVNAGPSPFAGKRCMKNYFVGSYENSALHAAGGAAANELGYKRVALVAPNYQAGRDALAGFKREYKGEVVAELYTKLDQNDFSVEMARLRDLNPDAIYEFHPGGLGINFAKQYAASGLGETIPMILPVFSMDNRMLKATGDSAEGLYTVALWSQNLDVPANKAFVEAFQKEYGRMPTHYAATAYDTANLIGSALKAVDGDISKTDAFRDAMRKADFNAVRGNFKFDTNHHPIQDYYLMKLERDGNGNLTPNVVRKVMEMQEDVFKSECEMN